MKKSPFRIIIPAIIIAVIIGLVGFFGFRLISNRTASSSSATKSNDKTTSQDAKSNTTATGAASGEIVYWGLWEPSTVLNQVFQKFEAANPGVTVTYTQQSHKDYRERLQSALAKGTGPDIFRFHNTWVPMLRSELGEIPSDIMSTSEFQSTFYPVASTDLKSPKSHYGIPLMIDGLALYYNKDIFQTSNVTPPSSWDELRQLATQLTIRSGGKIERAGIALGITSNVDNYSDTLGLMLLQNNADPSKPTTSLAQDALTFYTLFSSSDNVWDATLPPSTFAFATEKVAMIIAPSWRAHEIADINPELQFVTVPVPQLPSSQSSWASYWVEGVSSSSKNSSAAWQLLKYMSSKEVMRQMYTAASNERQFGEPFSRVDMADQLLTDPIVGAYIQQAPYAQSWYLASRTFDNGINDKIIKYYEDAINATTGSSDSTTALKTTAQGVLQVLSQYSSGK